MQKPIKNNRFPKKQRLCSQKLIDELFGNPAAGGNVFLYPFKLVFMTSEALPDGFPQVLFSVPKKVFRHAVQRNLIRRRMKEAYRTLRNDNISAQAPNVLAFVYVGKKAEQFAFMKTRMEKLLKQLQN